MVWPRLAKNHQDLMKKLAEDPEAGVIIFIRQFTATCSRRERVTPKGS